MKDIAAERILIGTICKHGKNALIDALNILDSDDFSSSSNRAIFSAIKSLSDDPKCNEFDAESIKLKLKSIGYKELAESQKICEYIDFLPKSATDISNLSLFAIQVRKFAIARGLHDKYSNGVKYLEGITGKEKISDILQNTEGLVDDFINGINTEGQSDEISDDIEEHIESLLKREPVTQVGIPTGFPIWDDAIGGGPRRGTVNVIAARPKTGKSFVTMNQLRNIAKRGIPVLYLDTELTREVQKNRLISIESGCPLKALETGQFRNNTSIVKSVIEAKDSIKKMPITYKCIAGMSHTEALMFARRWIIRNVGIRPDGKANDCVIAYDYLKLTSGDNLSSHTPEHILIGLMMTDMQNFALKYDIPFIAFVQLNRDGIDNNDTSIISQSDRILWLCSSLSVLRNKCELDIEQGSSWDYGNKKIQVLETRYGQGTDEFDYINLIASLRPKTNQDEANGLIAEGLKFSDLIGKHVESYISKTS